jgi:hypothetical protein
VRRRRLSSGRSGWSGVLLCRRRRLHTLLIDAASCADFAAAIVDGYADLADALDEREAGIQADREGMRAQAAWHDPVWGRWCEDGVVVGEEWDGDVDDTMTMGPDDVWEDEDEDKDSYESEGGSPVCTALRADLSPPFSLQHRP